jgi:hypothetical protein
MAAPLSIIKWFPHPKHGVEGVIMSTRTKLTLASLPMMMLPYRIDFTVTVLIVTAIISTAIDLAKERFDPMQVSRNFIYALLVFLRPVS